METNNRLIAEFLRWDSNETKTVYYDNAPDKYGDGWDVKNLPFLESWDFLMLAVEKCFTTVAPYQLHKAIEDALISSSIDRKSDVYKAVVDFIEYPRFKNNQLQRDFENLLCYDEWCYTDITEDYIEGSGFVLDIKDNSYFYEEEEDRNFDDILIMNALRDNFLI